MNTMTLGVIIGNRDLFPGELAEKGRKEILKILSDNNVNPITAAEDRTQHGAVTNHQDAKICAEVFRQNREIINGIFISLPNFGDERAICDAIKMSELNVPVFVHAYPDDLDKFDINHRRDSFCGKLSACNNLKQYGIKYSLGRLHVTDPYSDDFVSDLNWFLGVCRVVKGLGNARIGSIGARTTAFKTVRYSEKLLEINGITVETVDLSEMIMAVEKLADSDKTVQSKLKTLSDYSPNSDTIPRSASITIAKLAVAIDRWFEENELDAFTIQCWPAMQDALKIFPCTLMSLMSNNLAPAACEADVMGAVSMYALQLASRSPSALFDWNNNYGNEEDKMVLFHCSNCPKGLMVNVKSACNPIAAKVIGEEKSYCAFSGHLKPGPITFARISTDDVRGKIVAYTGNAEVINDIETFGATGVVKINGLQKLLHYLCNNGFEHHVAISRSLSSDILFEAFSNYLEWEVYQH